MPRGWTDLPAAPEDRSSLSTRVQVRSSRANSRRIFRPPDASWRHGASSASESRQTCFRGEPPDAHVSEPSTAAYSSMSRRRKNAFVRVFSRLSLAYFCISFLNFFLPRR
jgi:hypothetical protein